jgi:RHS repeat-associated protein
MLTVFDSAASQGWKVIPFQIDWQPASSQTLTDLEAALLEAAAYETTTTYDALNRVKSNQLPADLTGHRATLLPSYNRAGALEQVHLDNTLYVEQIAYDAKGQRALISYGNGVMARYAYDPQTFRLTRLRTEPYTELSSGTYNPTGAVLQDFAYSYDLAGNIVEIQDRTPGSGILNNPAAANITDPTLSKLLVSGDALVRSFTYDPIYRLQIATGRECDQPPDGLPWLDAPRCTDITKARGYTETYGYDSVGSMLQLQHQNVTGGFGRTFAVNAANNRITSLQVGQTSYAYTFDPSGNMTSETSSRHFDWNYANQMKAFATQTDGAEPSVYAQYLYDSSGQRVKKLVRNQGGQTETTHYIYGFFEHHRWGSGTQSGENNRIHVMDDKQRIALARIGAPHPDDQGPVVEFQLVDHLGSSNVVVDSIGAFFNREEFTPYGETSFGSFTKKRFRFTSKERDEESGLQYNSARFYSPHLARWISFDPIALKPSNRPAETLPYSYVDNRPTISIDPEGLLAWLIVPLVLILLNEGTANAPGPRDKTYESTSDSAFLKGAVVDATALHIFAVRYAFLGGGAVAAAEAGAYSGIAHQGLHDAIVNHRVSSPGDVAAAAFEGAIVGLAAEGLGRVNRYLTGKRPGAASGNALPKQIQTGNPNRAVSGEIDAAEPGKRTGGVDGRVNPTRDAQSWPSRTVRLHPSIDPGGRVHIPAAAKRIIDSAPPVEGDVGPFDYGHKPGFEFWRDARAVRAGEMDQSEFRNRQQNPDHYQRENRSTNRAHSREKK